MAELLGARTFSARTLSARTLSARTLSARTLVAHLLHVHHRLAQLVDPLALVIADEPDAPCQRVAAAPGDAGVDQRVEHLALRQAEAGHHGDTERGEELLLVTAAGAPGDLAGEARLGLVGDAHPQGPGVFTETLDTCPTRGRDGLGGRSTAVGEDGGRRERAHHDDLVAVVAHG